MPEDLFAVCENPFFDALLDNYVQQGFVFLTPKQVMNVLDKTWGQVRYAIYNYALDCYLIAGNYRITVQALEDYISGKQKAYEEAYHDVMLQRELSGVHSLVFDGKIQEIYRSLQQHNYPVSAIDDLLLKDNQKAYDELPEGSTEMEDYYDIDRLNLPNLMYLYELADLLQVESRVLCHDMKCASYFTILDREAATEYLISKQFLNANVPVQLTCSQNISKDSGQLFLF